MDCPTYLPLPSSLASGDRKFVITSGGFDGVVNRGPGRTGKAGAKQRPQTAKKTRRIGTVFFETDVRAEGIP